MVGGMGGTSMALSPTKLHPTTLHPCFSLSVQRCPTRHTAGPMCTPPALQMIRVLNKDSTQPKDVMLEALKAFDIAMVVLPQQFQTFKWVFVRENPDKDHSSMVNNSPYQPLISLQAGSARPLAIHDGAPHPSPRSPRPQSPARGRSPSGRSPRLDAPPAPLPDAKARSPRLDVPHAAFPEAKGRSPRLDGVLAQATESRGRSPKAEVACVGVACGCVSAQGAGCVMCMRPLFCVSLPLFPSLFLSLSLRLSVSLSLSLSLSFSFSVCVCVAQLHSVQYWRPPQLFDGMKDV